MTSEPVRAPDQLAELFRPHEKSRDRWLIGLEAERFGLDSKTSKAIGYEGKQGVKAIYEWLSQHHGWSPQRETADGPLIALQRGGSSLTLEPGAQVELSGTPMADLHQIADEYENHLDELQDVSDVFGVSFVHLGFHPLARLNELSWVPKRRYPIMRQYLPTKGRRALDMMQRTATVQVNLDYSSERDALDKLLVLLRLTPLVQAMTVNAPFYEGQRSKLLSERVDVWQHMDPARSGLLLQLWDEPSPSYAHYVDWALHAGMFLFVRDGAIIENTGQTFRDFMEHGYRGHHPTVQDWQLHLGSLFPEVRLKSTLEIRCCDSQPPELTLAVPALLCGLTYDKTSLGQARELSMLVRAGDAVQLQHQVAQVGLNAKYRGETLAAPCRKLLDIAHAGLQRRAILDANGQDETCYLEPLRRLVEQGDNPATALLSRLEHADHFSLADFALGQQRREG
jgi:glutamate--cysteine ligase